MGKVMRLTPEQEARFPEFVKKWIGIGLSTAPADRVRAEAAIKGLYALTKLREPRVIWLPCPMSAALATFVYATLIARRIVPGDGEGKALAVDSAVDSAVHSAVHSAVRSAVDSAVGSAVGSAVRRAVGSASWYWLGGFWSTGYCAWADYFNEVLGIAIDRNYLETCETCGYYWTLDGICFASERPTQINLDDRGRLHSPSTQSIGYASGWGLYHWHGIQVPRNVIERPGEISVPQIESEQNAEVRRAMLERFGWERFITESGAELVHEDGFGKLYRRELAGDEPLVMVKVRNSTAEPDGSIKDYFLRVDPALRPLLADGGFGKPQTLRAVNAIASTFGMRGEQYAPQVES